MSGRSFRVVFPEPGWTADAGAGQQVAIYTPGVFELVPATILRVTARQLVVVGAREEARFRRGGGWGLTEGHETGDGRRLVLPRSALVWWCDR